MSGDMNNIGHTILDKYHNLVSKFTSPLKESKFYTEGKLTPEEYLLAGDFLVQKCPSWKWCAAKEGLSSKALPKDKQYLKTTVPCSRRAADYLKSNLTTEKEIEGDWVEANVVGNTNKGNKEDQVLDFDNQTNNNNKKVIANNNEDDDFFCDDDNNNNNNKNEKKEVDDFVVVDDEEEKGEVLKTRTYDVTVTYDFYYCVPRMWLMGYNENGTPLSDNEMKQDVMMEYRNKTVTIEPHPHTGFRNISVHPCRHSMLLKKMIENYQNSGKKLEIYMSILIFLKFLHSVVPTIQYDFTMDINF
jgi:ubiquitin-like-conjugating enzyme ATG3